MLIGTNLSFNSLNELEDCRQAAFLLSRWACNWTGNLLPLTDFRLAFTRD